MKLSQLDILIAMNRSQIRNSSSEISIKEQRIKFYCSLDLADIDFGSIGNHITIFKLDKNNDYAVINRVIDQFPDSQIITISIKTEIFLIRQLKSAELSGYIDSGTELYDFIITIISVIPNDYEPFGTEQLLQLT